MLSIPTFFPTLFWNSIHEDCVCFPFSCNMFRIKQNEDVIFDDLFIRSIESFLPHRNEVIKIFQLLANGKHSDEAIQIVHRFFEGLI